MNRKPKSLCLYELDGNVHVKGDTFPLKDLLKRSAVWNPSKSAWIFLSKSFEEVENILGQIIILSGLKYSPVKRMDQPGSEKIPFVWKPREGIKQSKIYLDLNADPDRVEEIDQSEELVTQTTYWDQGYVKDVIEDCFCSICCRNLDEQFDLYTEDEENMCPGCGKPFPESI